MALAIQRDLYEFHDAQTRRRRLRKIEKDWRRRILRPERAMASTVRAVEAPSWRDTDRGKFESVGVHSARCWRSGRGSLQNKRTRPRECRTSECRARPFATNGPAPDTENRISQRSSIPADLRSSRRNPRRCVQLRRRLRYDENRRSTSHPNRRRVYSAAASSWPPEDRSRRLG